MGKSAPTPPTPPNPTQIINQSAGANKDTANYQSILNNANYSGPQGSVNWTQNSNGQWTQNANLSAAQQNIYNSQTADQYQAMLTAGNQIGRVNNSLEKGLSAPEVQMDVPINNVNTNYQSGGPIQSGYSTGPSLQYGFDQGAPIQTDVSAGGPAGGLQSALGHGSVTNPPGGFSTGGGGGLSDRIANGGLSPGQPFSSAQPQGGGYTGGSPADAVAQDSNAVYQQAASRLDPQWQQSQEQLQAQLAAQGLGANSTAYQNEVGNFNRAKNDAYNQANYSAIQAGAGLQGQLFGEGLQQGQFHNTAAGQQFGQGYQGQQAYNQAQLQGYGENQQQAAFNNTAQAQADAQSQAHASFFNTAQQQYFQNQQQNAQLHNQASQQRFQDTAYSQEQPINELTALLGLGQVSMPQSQQGNTSVAPVDVTGAYGLQSAAQQANYQSQMQNYQSTMGGLFNLGGAGLQLAMMSDRRLKRDITRLGRRDDGIGIYRYRFIGHDGWHVGVMAQEVRKIRPDAVHDIDGILHVDYARLAA